MLKVDGLDRFTTGYLYALTELGLSEDDKDKKYTYSNELYQSVKNDCAAFQKDNAEILNSIYSSHYNEESAGIDFYLTRCRHGAGFWDRNLGDAGNKLTQAAHVYGDVYTYIGDDGKLY